MNRNQPRYWAVGIFTHNWQMPDGQTCANTSMTRWGIPLDASLERYKENDERLAVASQWPILVWQRLATPNDASPIHHFATFILSGRRACLTNPHSLIQSKNITISDPLHSQGVCFLCFFSGFFFTQQLTMSIFAQGTVGQDTTKNISSAIQSLQEKI